MCWIIIILFHNELSLLDNILYKQITKPSNVNPVFSRAIEPLGATPLLVVAICANTSRFRACRSGVLRDIVRKVSAQNNILWINAKSSLLWRGIACRAGVVFQHCLVARIIKSRLTAYIVRIFFLIVFPFWTTRAAVFWFLVFFYYFNKDGDVFAGDGARFQSLLAVWLLIWTF